MHTIHPLIIDLTMITIYAGLTTLLCKKLKQPIILGYILAGILAGPHFNLLPTITDCFCNSCRKFFVTRHKPSSECDTVCLVVELLWINLIKMI